MQHQTSIKRAILSLALCAGALAPWAASAQSEAIGISAVSALPVASVVGTASVGASTVASVPLALSAAGGELVVRSVEVSAVGTVYLLERASDGARFSVQVVGASVAGASVAAGTVVTGSPLGTGVILSAAGQAISSIPNALGQALLHNERVTP